MLSPKNPFSTFLASRGPTAKTIQNLLRRIGAPTSGTKEVVQSRLFREISQWKPLVFTHGTSAQGELINGLRILSIDMGIKNLAFCVADARHSPLTGEKSMEIMSWRRIDLTDEVLMTNDKSELSKNVISSAKDTRGEDAFAPEHLSQTAYTLLEHNLLQYRPDVVLIERQRWRSSSSSAIQQWTVRVNSLEAMLWAVLATINARNKLLPKHQQEQSKKLMSVFPVDPKRVGTYWLDGVTEAPRPTASKKKVAQEEEPDDEEELDDEEPDQEVSLPETSGRPVKKVSRGKAEKKAKIQLLRTWLESEKPSTILSARSSRIGMEFAHRPTIGFVFRNEPNDARADAETTRQTFLYATDPTAKRPARLQKMNAMKLELRKDDVKKVDDLTDCILQAATWAAWEDNRAILKTHFDEFVTDIQGRLAGRKLRTSDTAQFVDQALKQLRRGSDATEEAQEVAEEETGTNGRKKLARRSTSKSDGGRLITKTRKQSETP
jgi:cruciform cutting endonuclease 1